VEHESIDFLLAEICRLHYARAHVHLERIGLYRGQPPLLMHLHAAEGLTHGELAGRLNVTPATMTKMIQRMERAGFVQRRADENDQRVSRVYLTDAGRAVRLAMLDALKTLEAETFAGLSNDDHAQLRHLFCRMRGNLLRALRETGTDEIDDGAAAKMD
jgi:DNA-binding MarR family transcriptional regulator